MTTHSEHSQLSADPRVRFSLYARSLLLSSMQRMVNPSDTTHKDADGYPSFDEFVTWALIEGDTNPEDSTHMEVRKLCGDMHAVTNTNLRNELNHLRQYATDANGWFRRTSTGFEFLPLPVWKDVYEVHKGNAAENWIHPLITPPRYHKMETTPGKGFAQNLSQKNFVVQSAAADRLFHEAQKRIFRDDIDSVMLTWDSIVSTKNGNNDLFKPENVEALRSKFLAAFPAAKEMYQELKQKVLQIDYLAVDAAVTAKTKADLDMLGVPEEYATGKANYASTLPHHGTYHALMSWAEGVGDFDGLPYSENEMLEVAAVLDLKECSRVLSRVYKELDRLGLLNVHQLGAKFAAFATAIQKRVHSFIEEHEGLSGEAYFSKSKEVARSFRTLKNRDWSKLPNPFIRGSSKHTRHSLLQALYTAFATGASVKVDAATQDTTVVQDLQEHLQYFAYDCVGIYRLTSTERTADGAFRVWRGPFDIRGKHNIPDGEAYRVQACLYLESELRRTLDPGWRVATIPDSLTYNALRWHVYYHSLGVLKTGETRIMNVSEGDWRICFDIHRELEIKHKALSNALTLEFVSEENPSLGLRFRLATCEQRSDIHKDRTTSVEWLEKVFQTLPRE